MMWLTPSPELYPIAENVKIVMHDIEFEDYDYNIYTSKRGFPTDGVSMPTFCELLWDKFEPQIIRSIIQHDVQYILHDFDFSFIQTRKEVDARFLRSLRCENWPYAKLWYVNVRMFGQYIWSKQCDHVDAINWWQAVKQGEEAIDEWISKIIEQPDRLEMVKYSKQIQADNRRLLRSIYYDTLGLAQWILKPI